MKEKDRLQAADKHQELQKEEETYYTCNICGEKFEKPLFTSIFSEGFVQNHYACPRCLSEIPDNKEKVAEGKNEAVFVPEQEEKDQSKLQNVKCQHFLGYLKKRPKEAAIPEACLTCENIIKCMSIH